MSVIKLTPAIKDYLWGGNKLKERYGAKSDGIVAEMWAISCHPDGPSLIEKGEYQGKTLSEYIESKGREILGTRGMKFEQFPILVKLLDANKDLSIQVHPDDKYGLRVENEYGKNEMWLVLEAEPGALIYHGVKEAMTKGEFRQAIDNSIIVEKLNAVETKPYDFFNIPAGTIHALGKGNVIAEVQQSSNSTYRIYDFDRKDAEGNHRELHIDKATDVSDLSPIITDRIFDWRQDKIGLVDNEFFKTTYYRILEYKEMKATSESFQGLLVIKGEGTLSDGNNDYKISAGNGLFVESNTRYYVSGDVELLIIEV
ncbi:MAG: class I mannose-6-phosphate isomerase [Erysipelothrix sp.]|nr:class I mannose-6-phosphate isomerase [Erysipelothrix sp.]